jgi:hypothetical protein
MTMKSSITAILCLCALPTLCRAEPPNPVLARTTRLTALDAPKQDDEGPQGLAITDLKTQLAGTNWKAEPASHVRPGLYPTLKFNRDNAEPAKYRYEINPHDFTVRIFFNHGDTQLLLLSDNGQQLRFTFQGKDYVYALTGH